MRVAACSVCVFVVVSGCEGCPDPLQAPPQPVSGIACRATGEPAAGAVVVFDGPDDVDPAAVSADGSWGASLGQGTWRVSVDVDGAVRFIDEVVVDDEAKVVTDTACRPNPNGPGEGSVEGDICDRHVGNAVVDGRVVVVVGTSVTETRTDENAHFHVDHIPVGEGVVTVSAPDYNRSFVIDVVEGGLFVINSGDNCAPHGVSTGCIEARLCDDDGDDDAGRAVSVVADGAGADEATNDVTDTDGFVEFCGLVAGAYEVRLEAEVSVVVNDDAGDVVELGDSDCDNAPVCEEFVHSPTTTADGRIYFVVDRSGSMDLAASGFDDRSKWEALKTAIDGVTATLTTNIDYALMAFPDPRETICESQTTDVPCPEACLGGLEREAMGADAATINTSLGRVEPFGGTPTAATLARVLPTIDLLTVIDRPLAVVLATDGAPNCATTDGLNRGDAANIAFVDCAVRFPGSTCTSDLVDGKCPAFNCLDTSAAARVADIAALGVAVHVIGIRGDEDGANDGVFVDTLNDMAVAGGAPVDAAVRFHDARDTDTLEAALEAVSRRIVACSIRVPFDVDSGVVSVSVGAVVVDADPVDGWSLRGEQTLELHGDACALATDTGDDVTVSRCD